MTDQPLTSNQWSPRALIEELHGYVTAVSDPLGYNNALQAVEAALDRDASETSGDLPLARNALGNLYMAVLKFGPIDRDIQFAMNEAGQLLGSPLQVKTGSAHEP